jgi:hypothetical protein
VDDKFQKIRHECMQKWCGQSINEKGRDSTSIKLGTPNDMTICKVDFRKELKIKHIYAHQGQSPYELQLFCMSWVVKLVEFWAAAWYFCTTVPSWLTWIEHQGARIYQMVVTKLNINNGIHDLVVRLCLYTKSLPTCGTIDLRGISSSWRLAQNSQDAIFNKRK